MAHNMQLNVFLMINFELLPLPYPYNALEPVISEQTVRLHHDNHQKAYVDHLNILLKSSEYDHGTLVEIIQKADGLLLEQASQVWNHQFYWNCMNTGKTSTPQSGMLHNAIIQTFQSFDKFQNEFEEKGKSLFGSGWLWLVSNTKGELQLLAMHNAGNPLRAGLRPILACDLWEHAYYLDYHNFRDKYLRASFGILNWNFAELRYAQASQISEIPILEIIKLHAS